MWPSRREETDKDEEAAKAALPSVQGTDRHDDDPGAPGDKGAGGTKFSGEDPDIPGTKSSGGTRLPEKSTVFREEGVTRPNSVHGIMKCPETVGYSW